MSLSDTLDTEKISKLLRKYALPSIIAMTASSLYNIVDSIFIGHGVGALAISGLAVAFPFQNLSAAFGMLVGIGASSLLSIRLGEKDYKTAKLILGNVILLNIIIGVVFTFFSLLFLDPILFFFGASEHTIGYARDYMQVILLGNIITHIYMGLNSVLRASGHPWKSMYATLLTVVLNAILNPIFLFVFDWGIQGVAVATVLSQIVALTWQVKIFRNKNELLHFHRGIFRLKKRIVFDSLKIGLAPFLMTIAGCFIVILINQQLKTHGGDLAIGAFGIVNRISYLFLMIIMGINQGMQPIVGYNYGAKLYGRVLEVLKLTMLWATVVTTVGFILVECFPGLMSRIFTSEKELIELTERGLRIAFIAFPLIAFQLVSTIFFQSIGISKKAIFLSLTRQVLFLIPLLIILPAVFGLDGVWLSLPITDFLSAIVTSSFMISQVRKLRQRMLV